MKAFLHCNNFTSMMDETVDEFWAMRPILYMSKCLLGAPYSIIGDFGSKEFVVKRKDICLYLLQLVVVIFVFGREIYLLTKNYKGLNMIDIFQLIFVYGSVLIMVVTNIMLFFNVSNDVSGILLEIQRLDKELQTPTELEYRKARRICIYIIVLRYCMCLLVVITSLIVYPGCYENLLSYVVVHFIDFGTEFQVLFLLNCIRNKFSYTNKLLKNCISIRIDSINLAGSNKNYKIILVERVKQLIDIFDRCRNMCEVINKTFGMFIVANLLNVFRMVVITLYLSILTIKTDNYTDIISLGFWVTFMFMGVTIIMIFCELIVFQVREKVYLNEV